MRYKGSTGIQCPPTPTPGLKGMKPYGLDDAASITSWIFTPLSENNWVSSFIKAIFTSLNTFSNSFAASAISGEETETIESQIDL